MLSVGVARYATSEITPRSTCHPLYWWLPIAGLTKKQADQALYKVLDIMAHKGWAFNLDGNQQLSQQVQFLGASWASNHRNIKQELLSLAALTNKIGAQ